MCARTHACVCMQGVLSIWSFFFFYHCPWAPDWNANSMFQHKHLPDSHTRSHFWFFFLSTPTYNLWASGAGSEVAIECHPLPCLSLPSYLVYCPLSSLLPFLPIEVHTLLNQGLTQALLPCWKPQAPHCHNNKRQTPWGDSKVLIPSPTSLPQRHWVLFPP